MKRQQRIKEHISEVQSSSDVVRQDIKTIDEKYSALTNEVEELKTEKQEIKEELKRQNVRFDSLYESHKYYERKIHELETKLEQKDVMKDKLKEYSDKLEAIESELQEKKLTIVDLSSKLEETEYRYAESQQKMAVLVKESTNKRAGLREKLSVLKVLQDSLLPEYSGDIQQAKAKQPSQNVHTAKFKVRIIIHVYPNLEFSTNSS